MTIYIIGINYIQSFINLSFPVLKPVSRLTSFSSVVANLLMASMHVMRKETSINSFNYFFKANCNSILQKLSAFFHIVAIFAPGEQIFNI